MHKPLISALFACFLSAALPVKASSDLTTLMPEPVHQHTLQDIVKVLQDSHYRKVTLNDELSSQLLDEYLQALDPNRSFFFQADIDEFQPARNQLDDALQSGDLSIPFAIYNRFQIRSRERLLQAIGRLQDSTPFDFNKQEVLVVDREKAPWIDQTEAMDELWRKRTKSAVLNLILADKTPEQAREVLIKRYRSQLQRLSQTNSEDVFQRFSNVVTQHFDPHTAYFSPRTSENFKINMSLSLEGIGAVLQGENEFTKVVRLVPAGPADKTGQIKPGDLIVGVGQGNTGEMEDVVGWRLDDVVDKIRGPKGSLVRLEIIPAGSKDQSLHKVVPIERNTVKLEEQAAKKRVIEISHNAQTYRIGVIDLPAFYVDYDALQQGDRNYKSSTRDVEKLISELDKDHIDGLIIDLRNNGGGSLREANSLVGLFIDRGPTVQIRNAQGRVDILGDRDPHIAYRGPLAVLVNRVSASASEIFAGAIQDYQRGLVLGDQTFGKGTVQTLVPLEHGQLKLTSAKFYRISGDSTQNKGVIPDIIFPSLLDKESVGESTLPGALPWDQVHQARHNYYSGLITLKPQLKRNHELRTQNEPDFNFMREQVDHIQDLREETQISLNQQQLQEKRDRIKQWQLDAENRRRSAKGEALIQDLSELDELNEKDAHGRPISAESEAILHESGKVLIDFANLARQVNTAAAKP